ncbi:MAG: hypothetical protein LC808_00130 [Actinobacteria bacterium]|nr:hypothetical protein [Actinomycetota bacterium]
MSVPILVLFVLTFTLWFCLPDDELDDLTEAEMDIKQVVARTKRQMDRAVEYYEGGRRP